MWDNILSIMKMKQLSMKKSRGLLNLCNDYSNMFENFGLYKTAKSDRIKDLFILHFRDTINFHTRHEGNKIAKQY